MPVTSTSPPTTVTSTTTTQPLQQVGIEVICREAWGALPAAGEFTDHSIERITVHHTAVLLDDNRMAPARIRQHQQFHQSREWPDLAYHFIIDAGGNVYEGRPVDAVGDTGTDYDPTGHLLICCEGDFNQQEIGADQYDALVRMVAWGTSSFEVDPDSVAGHRDVAATSCPGDDLYERIESGALRADAVDATADSVVLVPLCGAAAAARVAAIEA